MVKDLNVKKLGLQYVYYLRETGLKIVGTISLFTRDQFCKTRTSELIQELRSLPGLFQRFWAFWKWNGLGEQSKNK